MTRMASHNGQADRTGNSEVSRHERARAAAGFDRLAAEWLITDAEDGDAELDVGATDIEGAYPEEPANEVSAQQARVLARARSQKKDADRANRVASVARKHAAADIPPSVYAATFVPLFEEIVTEALAGSDASETVEAEILGGLRSAMVDMQVGLDEFAEKPVEPLVDDDYGTELSMEEVFDAVPYPALLVDAQHTMLQYNVPQRRLLGLDDDHRDFLGKDSRDTLAQATYSDGRRRLTLADKVIQAPRNADREWDIDRVDDDNEYTDRIVYRDTSVMKNTAGEEIHIEFFVIPIFDGTGDLKAVFEITLDKTETVHYEQAVEELVTEVSDTLDAIGSGDLAARVDFEDDRDVIETDLLTVTDEINEMARNFQQLVARVREKTDELENSIERTNAQLREIDETVDEQEQSLSEAATETEEFSATMQEVAASSEQVANATERALEEAERGVTAGEDADAVMAEVRATSDNLIETVEQLDAYMDEIDEVTEVIADVADQTNMLALNANIEAARADEDGKGFAVVADEIKSLAEETRTHAEKISDRVGAVQKQATQTVTDVDRSHEQIQKAQTEITTAVEALRTISERIEEATDGVREVAQANDEQANTVQTVVETIDEVNSRARKVSGVTGDIVTEAETQEAAVYELTELVRELTTDEQIRRIE